jgi:hypothetical protein
MGSMQKPQTTSVSGRVQARASQVGQCMRTWGSGRGAGGANTAGTSASSGTVIVSAGVGVLVTARPCSARASCTRATDSGSVGHADRDLFWAGLVSVIELFQYMPWLVFEAIYIKPLMG